MLNKYDGRFQLTGLELSSEVQWHQFRAHRDFSGWSKLADFSYRKVIHHSGKKMLVNVYFSPSLLQHIRLLFFLDAELNSDQPEYVSEQAEAQRRLLYDDALRDWRVSAPHQYFWGSVSIEDDISTRISQIHIDYTTKLQHDPALKVRFGYNTFRRGNFDPPRTRRG